MEYDQYRIEDFIADESFQQYCLGSNEEAVKFWNEWLAQNSHRKTEAVKAREIYVLLNGGHDAKSFARHQAAMIEALQKNTKYEIRDTKHEVQKKDSGGAKGKLVGMPGAGRRTIWWAAAAVLLVILGGGYLMLTGKKEPKQVVKTEKPVPVNDIAPGGDRATLTLADGTRIILDSAVDGSLAQQGGIKVIKIGGQLAYTPEGTATEVLYNTISTPKGGQYQLVLADGTKVWLNAASSLRFPTAFTGKERMVELTGEGYFEVSSKSDVGGQNVPFSVEVNGMTVEVLGTHFNINSYDDEPSMKTTLLEGKVRVKRGANYLNLHPGQQAIIQPGQDNIKVSNDVDVEEVMAWKNGYFLFTSADLETIMRQAARWYNVEVVYNGKTSETFSGNPTRSDNISKFLKIIGATDKVEFDIRGRQVVVKPK